MFVILGSGFGLYGYLPALAGEHGERLVLPERYRPRLLGRPELSGFGKQVLWAMDDSAALDRADGAVLALPPGIQSARIEECLARPEIGRILLEKPLAQTPADAQVLLDRLLRSKRAFRIGYTFRYTDWGEALLKDAVTYGERDRLSIRWRFMAHHYSRNLDNWKRWTGSGGGAIRFYGIQLIALLAEIGYRNVHTSFSAGDSANEIEKWTAVFTGTDLPECAIEVDSKSAVGKFCIELQSGSPGGVRGLLAEQDDPFGAVAALPPGRLDRRVALLARLCGSLAEPADREYAWYAETLALWARVEESTQFESSRRVASGR